jgi:hypothetical protein
VSLTRRRQDAERVSRLDPARDLLRTHRRPQFSDQPINRPLVQADLASGQWDRPSRLQQTRQARRDRRRLKLEGHSDTSLADQSVDAPPVGARRRHRRTRWLADAEADHGGAMLRRRAAAHEPGAGAAAAKE